MKTARGDLLALTVAGEFDVLVHGCNCHCVMGAGIARAIAAAFPEARVADESTRPGDRSKLGTLTHASVRRDGHQFTVVNAYTQFHHSGDGVLVDYAAVDSAMRAVRVAFAGLRIAYPRIGAGLGGGDWARIAAIIEVALAGEDHTLVELTR